MGTAERRFVEDTLRTLSTGVGMESERNESNAMDRFGCLTFNKAAMKRHLSKAVFDKLVNVIENNEKLDAEIADEVAHGMKEWALGQGATHFTHWFQPVRGETAEKHDTFLSLDSQGQPIIRFSGRQLIQSEPDASSFPSGGMRSTFEARGYTAWDPTSPAFLLKTGKSATLVVPSVFISWTGEALDMKMPLLRALHAVEDRAYKLVKLFGNRTARYVRMTVGAEQEYFLVSKEYFNARPDLLCAGRTLFGAASAKNQQMEDHYFGSIKPKVLSFMCDLDAALFERGIPAKTRHNEVAPNQFELAPLYEEANLAIDHNLQAMEIMRRLADEHGLAILFHEKPFAGINGSGKHLNWSLGDSDGNNLFEPGAAPKKNIQFLAFTAALMAGVDKYGAVLRQSVADAGNDHRLGANEAPPAIMSVYLGEHLTALIDEIVKGGKDVGAVRDAVDHGLKRLPQILRDSSDRNRTSPIAFTGNKFEFRAVGASQNTSDPAAAWAVIMAYGIDQVIAKLEKAKGADITDKALAVVREIFKATARVRFEGNGYGADWHKEAAKRGLPNTGDTPSAVEVLSDKAVADLYEAYKVLNKEELAAKKEIKLETYVKTKEIELTMLSEMAQTGIVPALARQIDELGRAREALAAVKADAKLLEGRIREAGTVLAALYSGLDGAKAVLAKSCGLDAHHRAAFLADKGVNALGALRDACDKAEGIVEGSLWPYPKYREMLFLL